MFRISFDGRFTDFNLNISQNECFVLIKKKKKRCVLCRSELILAKAHLKLLFCVSKPDKVKNIDDSHIIWVRHV